MNMHPKYPYITENAEELRGKDIDKLVKQIWNKIARNKVQKGEPLTLGGNGLYYDMETSKGPRYVSIITTAHPHWRLYDVAWTEYWNMPLNKALS